MTQVLAQLTSPELARLRGDATRPLIALVPVGSTEPHGPHLPLATDALISEAACTKAAQALQQSGYVALIAPTVSYGVTDFAEGFVGAVSVPAAVLTSYLGAIVDGLVATGFGHVCLVNNHLEPAHDAAVRLVVTTRSPRQVSVACPLTRRWAAQLGPEFRSGACHAGQYETSIVLAGSPDHVRTELCAHLPEVPISLSDGIRNGLSTFTAMGLADAYAGTPAAATSAEGHTRLATLSEMIVSEVMAAIVSPNSV